MKNAFLKSLLSVCFLSIFFVYNEQPVAAFSPQVIQHGATGEDVVELQARLQYLGFYNSQIDGVFGWGTYWALRNFQYEFGMEIDGLAGQEVKDKLVSASNYDKAFIRENIEAGRKFTYYGGMSKENQVKQGSGSSNQQPNNGDGQSGGTVQPTNEDEAIEPTASNVPNGFSQNDIQLMAQAVYGEARGEPYEGQVAVAAVILNRIQNSIFPDSVSGVIYEPLAFTAVADGQIYLEPDETARRAVLDAINGWDPSGEAIYYFNPDTATSTWIWSRPQIKRIGKHVFCM
ncbi:N-acetylmuramoyl-L-alanine amidase [Amphibacillus marinus]|uniref:Spore cortex-lytic enzyme n=1 Tax=Amphibacillus marinus TaxID=872970 RepID=A0A1H8GDM7_9BACI|nr:spore cortex-lytic enzyme [Amphibacillus marinus]SEN42136.1 N-acetylmuramoyl-L-alanine amidase [Amphibacillus marinus]